MNFIQFIFEILSFLLNINQLYTPSSLKLDPLQESTMSDTILVAIMIAGILGANLQFLV